MHKLSKDQRVHLILGTRFGETAEQGKQVGKHLATNPGNVCFALMTVVSPDFLGGMVEGYHEAGGTGKLETLCSNMVSGDLRKLGMIPAPVC
jgi:hypothetical protein